MAYREDGDRLWTYALRVVVDDVGIGPGVLCGAPVASFGFLDFEPITVDCTPASFADARDASLPAPGRGDRVHRVGRGKECRFRLSAAELSNLIAGPDAIPLAMVLYDTATARGGVAVAIGAGAAALAACLAHPTRYESADFSGGGVLSCCPTLSLPAFATISPPPPFHPKYQLHQSNHTNAGL